MNREDIEIVDLGIASVETQGPGKGDLEPIGRRIVTGISDD